jgi:hypothetical protein
VQEELEPLAELDRQMIQPTETTPYFQLLPQLAVVGAAASTKATETLAALAAALGFFILLKTALLVVMSQVQLEPEHQGRAIAAALARELNLFLFAPVVAVALERLAILMEIVLAETDYPRPLAAHP